MRRYQTDFSRRCVLIAAVVLCATGMFARAQGTPPSEVAASSGRDAFAHINLPAAWQTRFWSSEDAQGLLKLDEKALAALVPTQAGLKWCRCPACDAPEADDPLVWSPRKPEVITCKRCKAVFPNDKIPAKTGGSVPEEVVEVAPGVVHHYPYHVADAEKQAYPDERLYLAAKRDDLARRYLAKAALYAAVRHRDQGGSSRDPKFARTACLLLARFAQVVPQYAYHRDQPASPKVLLPAELKPPFEGGYQLAKWDAGGGLDVPINLAAAYAIVRDLPELEASAASVGLREPSRAIEEALFRAPAAFLGAQPEDAGESSLNAIRGIMAAGRVLRDDALLSAGLARLDRFAARGFYFDGLYRDGGTGAQRRVLARLEGGLAGLVTPDGDLARGGARGDGAVAASFAPKVGEPPLVMLSRRAASALLATADARDIEPASLRAGDRTPPRRRGMLLGGAGLARLAIGRGGDALDVELRDLAGEGARPFDRLAIRVHAAGRPVLGDLDDDGPRGDGYERATASHNTVLVDSLNQRELIARAADPAPGGNVAYFAADDDFQVVSFDDPRAYPFSTQRYRRTLVAVATAGRARFLVDVFEVGGGLQHDWLAHAAPGFAAVWKTEVALPDQPRTLLPPAIEYLPQARAQDGRWFVQALGAIDRLASGRLSGFAQADLVARDGVGARLHLLHEFPAAIAIGSEPDAPRSPHDQPRAGDPDAGRSVLVARRSSLAGTTLKSAFVSVVEPRGPLITPLSRVGRVKNDPGIVVVYVETSAGPEHLVINLNPGMAITARLADGGVVETDGRVVRLNAKGLTLAGGRYARYAGRAVARTPLNGVVLASGRGVSAGALGWFDVDIPLPADVELKGRSLLIRHGDRFARGWTIDRVEARGRGARIFVVEEPGFAIDPATGAARYYQLPGTNDPGPHLFTICTLAYRPF